MQPVSDNALAGGKHETGPGAIAEVPLVTELAWADRGKIREMIRQFPIVRSRMPGLRPEQLTELAKTVGSPIPARRPNYALPGHKEIMRFGNVKSEDGKSISGSANKLGFHSDMSWWKDAPEFTLLYAVEVPELGGDTQFSSMYRLYSQLDVNTRNNWKNRQVLHKNPSPYFEKLGIDERITIHPLIQLHPDTGRKLVFASPGYATQVAGCGDEESDQILKRINSFVEKPDYIQKWRAGDLVIWDNRAVAHSATAFDKNETRYMWRISIRARK